VVVNNATNIGKINNHLSHQTIEHKKKHDPGLRRALKYGWIKPFNGIPNPLIIESPTSIQKNLYTFNNPLKKTTHYHLNE
jgi:hypothetical protein